MGARLLAACQLAPRAKSTRPLCVRAGPRASVDTNQNLFSLRWASARVSLARGGLFLFSRAATLLVVVFRPLPLLSSPPPTLDEHLHTSNNLPLRARCERAKNVLTPGPTPHHLSGELVLRSARSQRFGGLELANPPARRSQLVTTRALPRRRIVRNIKTRLSDSAPKLRIVLGGARFVFARASARGASLTDTHTHTRVRALVS